MDDDWDLHAVVRGCAAASSSSTAPTSSSPFSSAAASSSFQSRQEEDLLCMKDPYEFGAPMDDLHDLYKPFFPALAPPLPPPPPSYHQDFSPPCAAPISPLSVLGGLQDLSPSHPILNPTIISSSYSSPSILQPKKHSFPVNIAPKTSLRTKRRKNQMKRVCQVPAEGLSSDVWSWRKYGQKPIKGSPYPRGYYRCSTSKGCLARKQVERNRSDPNMFIVTYTAEHSHPMPTHRNSLAGSTRQKPTTTTHQPETSGEGNKLGNSSPASSPAPEKQESSRDEDKEDICDDDDDDDGLTNPELDVAAAAAAPADDDFFEGLEDLVGDCFPSNFPDSGVQFPWLGNTAATTAAGGS